MKVIIPVLIFLAIIFSNNTATAINIIDVDASWKSYYNVVVNTSQVAPATYDFTYSVTYNGGESALYPTVNMTSSSFYVFEVQVPVEAGITNIIYPSNWQTIANDPHGSSAQPGYSWLGWSYSSGNEAAPGSTLQFSFEAADVAIGSNQGIIYTDFRGTTISDNANFVRGVLHSDSLTSPVSAVPIPSSLLLLGAGFWRIAAYRRRKS